MARAAAPAEAMRRAVEVKTTICNLLSMRDAQCLSM
jgi:hypothetical protein